MKRLSSLIQPLHHCEDSVMYLLNLIGVKVTKSTLQNELVEHPNYPSMLAISDVVGTYGVRNMAVKLDRGNWNDNLIPPFLAHINSQKLKHNLFSVITNFSDEGIEMYNPEIRKVLRIDNGEFVKAYYRGTVMAFEAAEIAGEKRYQENFQKESKRNLFYWFLATIFPLITIITSVLFVLNNHISVSLEPVVFTILTMAGVAAGALLIWYELDEYNPFVKQICQAGKKINCSAVLGSKGAKFLGLTWSTIGLSYFMGILLLLLSGGLYSPSTLTLLGWLSILALPYVIFSIYYQWHITKQWCVICLLVQGLLVGQFATTVVGGFVGFVPFSLISMQSLLAFAVPFIFPFTFFSLLVPALQKAKTFRANNIELQRLKHNPKIFEALLTKQRTIERSTEGLGIILGNPSGKHKIIKVCNPYCDPCAKVHPILEEIIESNNDIHVQIIFMSTNSTDDIRRQPVLHFLAIAEKYNSEIAKEALDKWYSSPEKNYTDFASNYPMNGELEQQKEKINAMNTWCEDSKIDRTPTFFIDGYQMPDIYSISDLKYLLR